MDFRDALIPWADKTERYYHYFTKRELKKLFQQAGFEIQKIDSLVGVGGKHWRRANYYVIARKPVLS